MIQLTITTKRTKGDKFKTTGYISEDELSEQLITQGYLLDMTNMRYNRASLSGLSDQSKKRR